MRTIKLYLSLKEAQEYWENPNIPDEVKNALLQEFTKQELEGSFKDITSLIEVARVLKYDVDHMLKIINMEIHESGRLAQARQYIKNALNSKVQIGRFYYIPRIDSEGNKRISRVRTSDIENGNNYLICYTREIAKHALKYFPEYCEDTVSKVQESVELV